jgi:hypothetical protein
MKEKCYAEAGAPSFSPCIFSLRMEKKKHTMILPDFFVGGLCEKKFSFRRKCKKDMRQVPVDQDILSRVLSNLMDMENYLLCAGRAAIGLDVIFY